MNPTAIDWHRTAIVAVAVAVGIVGLVVAWKLTKLLLKLLAILVFLGIAAGLALWWHSTH